MGNLLSSNSTSSTPRLYEDVTLLLADPEKQFPEEFDPHHPFKTKILKRTSRETFCSRVANVNGEAVVALEDFDPTGQKDEPPELVELCDGATYIVVPREDKTTEKRVSLFALHAAFCSEVEFQINTDLFGKISPLR